jgi:aminoglycoside 6'-N-acetyltransferase
MVPMQEKLIVHQETIQEFDEKGRLICLRPLTEDDWELLLKWNNDKEVLFFAEIDDIESMTIAEVKNLYRSISKEAFCFIIKYDSISIGDCWLQRMNLTHIREENIGLDCRRIDLEIGEKDYWNKGIGTNVIRLLTRFALHKEKADRVFGIVSSHNIRSMKAFEKNGYKEYGKNKLPVGGKAEEEIKLFIEKDPCNTI